MIILQVNNHKTEIVMLYTYSIMIPAVQWGRNTDFGVKNKEWCWLPARSDDLVKISIGLLSRRVKRVVMLDVLWCILFVALFC
jgi:hypothetical protein